MGLAGSGDFAKKDFCSLIVARTMMSGKNLRSPDTYDEDDFLPEENKSGGKIVKTRENQP